MAESIQFASLSPADLEPVARLLHEALVQWYDSRLRQGARFGESWEPFRAIPQTYEALDPGECITARDFASNALLGVCFTHERETHLSVGIVATAPAAAGRGIARHMLELALAKAKTLGKPARLVSSLLNLDSFSLYTRLGFVPGTIFQDLTLQVPEAGMIDPPPQARHARFARPDEAARLADFELRQQGIRREKDYAFFLRNEVGSWQVLVLEDSDGAVTGFLVANLESNALGPGVAIDEATSAALLWRALDLLRGRAVLFLVPCAAADLVRTAYGWGARNVELHVAQSTSPVTGVKGVCFPTFLPESA